MKRHLKWLIPVAVLLILPYVIAIGAGWLWMYQRGWHLWWFASCLISASLIIALVWWIAARLNAPQNVKAQIQPATHWPPKGLAAWDEVEHIAERVKKNPPDWQDPRDAWPLMREIIEKVAKHYHPRSDQPMLEMPLPHLLQILEWVCRDLRLAFTANFPGSHLLTINDLLRAKRWAEFGQRMYLWYRIASFGVNPLAGLMREAQNAATKQMMGASSDQIKTWAIDYTIKRTGYYAIELYSGYLVLDDKPLEEVTTSESEKSFQQAAADEEVRQGEPLRILIIGQVKAGKSSLINALFGETKAAVDILPRTSQIDPYVIGGTDGFPEAILLDSGGYEDASRKQNFFEQARKEVERCDLVVLVTSAVSAARAADRKMLDELNEFFEHHPEAIAPPVVVVLSQIDRLRPPREWNPPYNLAEPQTAKERNIAAALQATADDLTIPPESIVPVCLESSRLYNVEEGLIPLVLGGLPQAQRVRCLRLLKHYKQEETWQRLREQAVNAGRLLAGAGKQAAGEAVYRLDDLVRRFATKK